MRGRGTVLVLAFLAGCASEPAPQSVLVWQKAGATRDDLIRVRQACNEEIDRTRAQRKRIEAEVRARDFLKCMQDKGWTWTVTEGRTN